MARTWTNTYIHRTTFESFSPDSADVIMDELSPAVVAIDSIELKKKLEDTFDDDVKTEQNTEPNAETVTCSVLASSLLHINSSRAYVYDRN